MGIFSNAGKGVGISNPLSTEKLKDVYGGIAGSTTGGLVGSVAGPIGTLAGGIAGGIKGAKDGKSGLTTPSIPTVSTGGSTQKAKPPVAPNTSIKLPDAPSGSLPQIGTTITRRQYTSATPAGMSSLAQALADEREGIRTTATPQMQAQMMDRKDVQDVAAQQMGTTGINLTPQEQFRSQQMSLAQQLAAQAAGTAGPSAAQIELQRAGERNIAQQMAMQAGATGPQAAAARRQAVSQMAQTGQELGRDVASLRMEEQSRARQELGALLAQGRTEDARIAIEQAGLDQTTKLMNVDNALKAQLANQGVDLEVLKSNAAAGNAAAQQNLQAELTKMGMDRQAIADYYNQEVALIGLEQQANLQAQELNAQADRDYQQGLLTLEQLKQQKAANELQAAMQVYQTKADAATEQMKADVNMYTTQMGAQSAQAVAEREGEAKEKAGLFGGLSTLGAGAMSYFSDRNLKKDIKSASYIKGDLGEFLASAKPYTFNYINKAHGKGPQAGPMAQDLEKSKIGKAAVFNTPQGKMVDYGKLAPANLAIALTNHQRLSALEEALMVNTLKKKRGKK